MRNMLILLREIRENNKTYYMFIQENVQKVLCKADAVRLINSYPARQRNCRVINNIISLKNGKLPVENKMEGKKITGVQIVTGKDYAEKCYVYNNAGFFVKVLQDMPFLKSQSKLIKQIDHAEIINEEQKMLKTPYGITSVINLSSGLQTLLNIIYIRQKMNTPCIVNISECGDNILPYIYKEVNNTDIKLYTSHAMETLPGEYSFFVNSKPVRNSTDAFIAIEGGDIV